MGISSNEIVKFWFEECSPKQWFSVNRQFDEFLRSRFSVFLRSAMKGDLDLWAKEPKPCLSLIIILDQFSRNLFRGKSAAFSNDVKAVKWCKYAVKNDYLDIYTHQEVQFCLMPLIHSENISDHGLARNLRIKFLSSHPRYESICKSWDHHSMAIQKFGRYPHRNIILNRKSTEKESEFLMGPNSSW